MKPNLKTTALGTIAVLVVAAIYIYFLYTPVTPFVVSLYVMAAFCIGLNVWLYLFANSDFEYIQKRATNKRNAGKATATQLDQFTSFQLGSRSSGNVTVVLNINELPKVNLFYGRWTVYHSELNRLELWHDHSLFGGSWYFIQYN